MRQASKVTGLEVRARERQHEQQLKENDQSHADVGQSRLEENSLSRTRQPFYYKKKPC